MNSRYFDLRYTLSPAAKSALPEGEDFSSRVAFLIGDAMNDAAEVGWEQAVDGDTSEAVLLVCDDPDDEIRTIRLPTSDTLPSFVVRLGRTSSDYSAFYPDESEAPPRIVSKIENPEDIGIGFRQIQTAVAEWLQRLPGPSTTSQGERVEELDVNRQADALSAIEELLGQFRAIQFDGALNGLEAAELQTQIDVLQAMIRNPVGPDVVITERAIAAALRIIRTHIPQENSAAARVIDLGTQLGSEDAETAGTALGAILDETISAKPSEADDDAGTGELGGATSAADGTKELTVAGHLKKGAIEGLEPGAKKAVETSLSYLPKGLATAVIGGMAYMSTGGKVGDIARAIAKFAAAVWQAVG